MAPARSRTTRIAAVIHAAISVAFVFAGALWILYLYAFASMVDPSLGRAARFRLIASKLFLDADLLFALASGLAVSAIGAWMLRDAIKKILRIA